VNASAERPSCFAVTMNPLPSVSLHLMQLHYYKWSARIFAKQLRPLCDKSQSLYRNFDNTKL
ncbi:TPA: hypothetical protein ACOLZ8_001463, partial [Vibrio parahaemolyticus]